MNHPINAGTPLLLVMLLSSPHASADEARVILRNGSQFNGVILREPAGDDPKDSWVIGLSSGTRVKLDANQVRKVERRSAELSRYAELLPELPDTADGHWKMAQWCQEQRLNAQRDYHLEQVLRHAPDHPDARRILGYGQIDGRWVRADEWMEQQGYVRYKGAWRLAQQVALMEQAEEVELQEKDWRRKLKMWRSWKGGKKDKEAIDNLNAIDDPLAVAGLVELLPSESDVKVRQVYVDLLAKLGTGAATRALIDTALHDNDQEIRVRCIDHLKNGGAYAATQAFAQVLSSPDNQLVNRAGYALGRLGATDAVLPLISALVTSHETVVKPTSNMQTSFGGTSGGSGLNGLSVGGGPKKIVRDLKNRSVLEALVTLTGQNHQYSEADWKQWYIRQHAVSSVNLRRDL